MTNSENDAADNRGKRAVKGSGVVKGSGAGAGGSGSPEDYDPDAVGGGGALEQKPEGPPPGDFGDAPSGGMR